MEEFDEEQWADETIGEKEAIFSSVQMAEGCSLDPSTLSISGDMSEDGRYGGVESIARRFEGTSMSSTIQRGLEKPPQAMLFDEFWLEEQLAILFADNGIGKSILAVQIAQSIASGIPIDGFRMTAPAQKVLYFDFEMSDRQLARRYSLDGEPFIFHENLIRYEMTTPTEGCDDVLTSAANQGTLILPAITALVRQSEAKVVVIDNISAICQETEDASSAMDLMKDLKRIKKIFGVSILVIAHTPKIDYSMPLTKNSLGGSKQVSNFVDSLFGIAFAVEPKRSGRYIKQIKSRDTQAAYDEHNVAVCKIEKQGSFLQFTFINFTEENRAMGLVKGKDASKPKKVAENAVSGTANATQPQYDRTTPYSIHELIDEIVSRDPRRDKPSPAAARDRAKKKIARSKYKVREGGIYYIDPYHFF